ncbi:MAG: site-specific integrase [Bacteroidetes bacterium]|nr:site-specific integrase [Bacteroidota bacterium]
MDGNPMDKTHQLIFLIYRYKKDAAGNNVMLKYSTGEKVFRKNWDATLQIAKAGVNLPQPEVDKTNAVLRKLKDAALEIVQTDRLISVDNFKRELDYVIGLADRPKSKSDTTLLEYVRKYIEKSTKHPRTIKKYQGVQNHLKRFQEYRGKVITFDQINLEFAEEFEQWLYKHTDVSSQTTLSKVIQILKEFVRDAYENGYHQSTSFQSRKFAVPRVKTSKQYLELDELEKLAKHNFESDMQLEQVRDLWVIAAYTGLRYSDFSRLKKKHIIHEDGIDMIQMETYKGRRTKADPEVIIPILPDLKRLLEKYNFEAPNPFPTNKNQDSHATMMNRYIKQVCERAGLNRMVVNKSSVKGELVSENVPLHQCVTNHTARYTFINIMLNDFEISPLELSKITGQSLRVLMEYERGDKQKNASKVHGKVIEAMKNRKLRIVG